MPDSQPARAHPRGPHTTTADELPTDAPASVAAHEEESELSTVRVREEGTGPYRCIVVDVPAGAHPASLATALRGLPIACEFVNMLDTAGTRSGGELRFRVHEHHPRVGRDLDAMWRPAKTGTRVPRLADDSPFTFAERPLSEGGAR
ncbi:conserved hypothetical protein [Parafrankia sp. Ea1.12]|uniref:hypothetical protein n=1 Tax=Parafrankia sp. Ea1.12 TaxID=573499 RepID=UPI000DA456B7|nr:hypothetical protein [Parafrankia sp. Ea1.12]SQD97991.1 conserved hypothetical protein [Parafrankia sp. Ea1.12]